VKKYAIIVAGGSGTRMKSTVPKQFLKVDGEPIIIKTVRQFIKAEKSIELVVVLPVDHIDYWRQLESEYPFTSSIKITEGGASRTESVRNGLASITEYGLVAIHDAVRPFVPVEVISGTFRSAERNGSGVAAVSLKDSIREVQVDGKSIARNREDFALVQTPQTFQIELIKNAYAQIEGDFSDDATVFEKANNVVFLVEGSYSNIKITTPEDLT